MKSCFSTLEERYRSVFPFRREILMCLDKSETFKFEDEDYENESLKVFRRLLKKYSPVKLHYTIFIRKVSIRLLLLKRVKSSQGRGI